MGSQLGNFKLDFCATCTKTSIRLNQLSKTCQNTGQSISGMASTDMKGTYKSVMNSIGQPPNMCGFCHLKTPHERTHDV